MSVSERAAIGLGAAAALAYLVTPVAILVARRYSFYDQPASQGHKGHTRPTPYLGGAAVMAAFALTLVVSAGLPARTLWLVGGVLVMVVVGTLDDRVSLPPRLRLGIEFALGAVVSAAGFGWQLGAGEVVDATLTGLWVAAVVNSFNLFDNMDGAASTMAAVVCAATSLLAVSTGATWAAVGGAALCGACLGFLPHNLLSRPARIFLGDGGSMPLGFSVAILVVAAARSAEPAGVGLLTGVMLVCIPALDTCLVIVSRRRRGVPIFSGGRDHLTHRTHRRVGSALRVAVLLAGAQAVVSGLVIVAAQHA